MKKPLFKFPLAVIFTASVFNAYAADYKNPALTAELRVDDLLPRMTLVEKIGQMNQFVGIEHIKRSEKHLSLAEMQAGDAHGVYPNLHSSKIPNLIRKGEIGSFLHVVDPFEANRLQQIASESRLGIPLLIGIDAIHGNGLVSGSTIYPSPLTMASSWNLDLVRQASVETALEMRINGAHWAFTPNIDIARDPRWGRVGETFGEDTYLVGEMGVAVIEGLQQGDFIGSEKVLANAKHFVAGGDPLNGLNLSPMDVSLRSLKQDFFPPFKRAVDAGVFTFMAAHNEINGVPAHANRFLFTDVLRDQWGFEGFVVSDWMDIERLKGLHRVAPTQKEAVFQAVDAGLDMHMHGPRFLKPLIELVEKGRISEARIDAAVRSILLAKFRLGLFENAQVDTTAAAGIMFNDQHQQTALKLARQGIVLLKNDKVLPLAAGQKIFVTGPNANNHTLMGDWVFEQPEENITTIVEGLKAVAKPSTSIDYFDVGDQVKNIAPEAIAAATERAKKADVAIVVVGSNSLRYDRKGKTAGENVARSSINLFGDQLALVKAVHASGVPTIVVLVNSRPLAEPWVVDNAAALIEAWEPGALGGQALAEIIFGEVNPSGKLPITVPYSAGHLQSVYNHKPSAFVRKYVDGPTKNLFEFGDGLSYTNFIYSKAKLDRSSIKPNQSSSVTVTVTNSGNRDGDEVVQLYIRDKFSRVTRPVKELKGFQRIRLKAKESRKVTFEITPDTLAYYDLDMNWRVEPGEFVIMVGSSSRKSDLKTVTLRVK
ncbi:glycoside hydrolase family 3 C-terminal domain-containing protein [Pseudomonadales bacterium]|nr:glycoside hydrolase family 3 C-terminal domain-containing protein [Pseudomonadales bacterium]